MKRWRTAARHLELVLSQGTALQAAEKLNRSAFCNKGTASAGPKAPGMMMKGFSP
jgi:hypothetical protein